MTDYKHWLDKITEDSLPNEDLKTVAGIIGIDPTVKLMCELQGTTISVPKHAIEQATKKARVNYIIEHYDGSKKSRLKLSQFCLLSEAYIYRIARIKNLPRKNQKTKNDLKILGTIT